MRILAYFDGSCGPKNPGGTAAWGFLIYDFSKKLLHSARGIIGSGYGMTNNVAEASAVSMLLKYIDDRMPEVKEAYIHGDSQIMINKLSGHKNRYVKTPAGHYVPYINEAIRIAAKLEARPCRLYFMWIPREDNTEADRLSKPE